MPGQLPISSTRTPHSKEKCSPIFRAHSPKIGRFVEPTVKDNLSNSRRNQEYWSILPFIWYLVATSLAPKLLTSLRKCIPVPNPYCSTESNDGLRHYTVFDYWKTSVSRRPILCIIQVSASPRSRQSLMFLPDRQIRGSNPASLIFISASPSFLILNN